MKTRCVIEFHDKCLKLSSWIKGPAGFSLQFVDVLEIEGKTPEQISADLLSWRKSKKIAGQNALALVSRQNAILRTLHLPSTDPLELKSMIALQAVTQIPYSPEEVVFDYLAFPSEQAGYTQVIIIILPKSVVSQILHILSKAAFKVDAISITSLGIMKYVAAKKRPSGIVYAAIDFDRTQSEICVGQGANFLHSRIISLGTADVASNQEEFLKQIDLTASVLKKEKLLSAIKEIYCVGDVAQLSPFADVLKKEYQMEVFIIDSHQLTNAKGLAQVFEQGYSLSAVLAEGVSQDKIKLNFIPAEMLSLQISQERFWQWVRLAVIGIGLAGSLVYALQIPFIQKQNYLNQVQSKIKAVKKETDEINKKYRSFDNMNQAVGQRVIVVDVISEIYKILPDDISIINLTMTNGREISLQGLSKESDQVNQLQQGMLSSSIFEGVNLEYVNRRATQEGDINYFKLSAKIKGAQ